MSSAVSDTSTPTLPHDLAGAVAAIVAKVGGGVRPSEIDYQLRRHAIALSAAELVDALCEAEARGLITPWAWTTGPEVIA